MGNVSIGVRRRLHRYTYPQYVALEAYLTIPTLREYIVVSHRERRITIYRRGDAGAWTMRVGIGGGRVSIETLGAELVVDAVYRNSSIK
jgi:Uma2 family endonuclease